MRISRAEQETIIVFDEDGGRADLYTASPRVIRKLDAAGLEAELVEYCNGKPYAKTYRMPRSSVKIRPQGKTINIGGAKR